jgi:ABC-type uncharacterized transport system fused permease/ATPase subunit
MKQSRLTWPNAKLRSEYRCSHIRVRCDREHVAALLRG